MNETLDNLKGGIVDGSNSNSEKIRFIDAMEENQKDVRKMVMDSYHDIEKGKEEITKSFLQN